MLKIYLAGPVDNCSSSEQMVWRRMVQSVYHQYKYMDPMAYEVDVMRGKKSMNEIKIGRAHV